MFVRWYFNLPCPFNFKYLIPAGFGDCFCLVGSVSSPAHQKEMAQDKGPDLQYSQLLLKNKIENLLTTFVDVGATPFNVMFAGDTSQPMMNCLLPHHAAWSISWVDIPVVVEGCVVDAEKYAGTRMYHPRQNSHTPRRLWRDEGLPERT